MPLFPTASSAPGGQPTAELSASIHALHAAIASEPEADDKALLTQALLLLMKVQAKNATQTGGGQGNALLGQLQSASGTPPLY